MDHIAIMNKKLGLISKILSGEKTIESRWYVSKKAPWNRIKQSDKVYFKNSGSLVTAKADVKKVLQFSDLNFDKVKQIMDEYGGTGKISLMNKDPELKLSKGKKYCILVFLENPKEIKPFNINKKGFGIGCAWICINNINKIII